MIEEDANSNSVSETINAVSGLVDKIPVYEDLVQPAARQAGKALETVGRTVNAALMPIRGVVWGIEKIEEFVHNSVSSKLENTPIEDIVTPRVTVAGPALEALRFTGNESTLREMYSNLLANAMDARTEKHVHPSFVEIIKQLLPQEAKLLTILSSEDDYPLVCKFYRRHTVRGGRPFGENLDNSQVKNVFIESYDGAVDDLNLSTAFDNLCRLQLLQVVNNTSHALEDSFFGRHSSELVEKIEIRIEQKDQLSFTSLGMAFIDMCVASKT
ncbi:hypothetical protein VCSRO184_3562 [Vibrio cholerae]|nr:hypothetical protein VCSRO184_3562 [Vibrio cholerae]